MPFIKQVVFLHSFFQLLTLSITLFVISNHSRALSHVELTYDAFLLDTHIRLADFYASSDSYKYVHLGTASITLDFTPLTRKAQLTAHKAEHFSTSSAHSHRQPKEKSPTGVLSSLAAWATKKTYETLQGATANTDHQTPLCQFTEIQSGPEWRVKEKLLCSANTLGDFFVRAPKDSEWHQTDLEHIQRGIPQLSSKEIYLSFPEGAPIRRCYSPQKKQKEDQGLISEDTSGWHQLSQDHSSSASVFMGNMEVFSFLHNAKVQVTTHRKSQQETWTLPTLRRVFALPSLFLQTAAPQHGLLQMEGWYPEMALTSTDQSTVYQLHNLHPAAFTDGLGACEDFKSLSILQSPLTGELTRFYSTQQFIWKLIVLPFDRYQHLVLLGTKIVSDAKLELENPPHIPINEGLLDEAIGDQN